jgi:hypothetical protein
LATFLDLAFRRAKIAFPLQAEVQRGVEHGRDVQLMAASPLGSGVRSRRSSMCRKRNAAAGVVAKTARRGMAIAERRRDLDRWKWDRVIGSWSARGWGAGACATELPATQGSGRPDQARCLDWLWRRRRHRRLWPRPAANSPSVTPTKRRRSSGDGARRRRRSPLQTMIFTTSSTITSRRG